MHTVYSGVLQRAAELLGGAEILALYLRVPPAWLKSWMRAERPPPTAVFLQAIDLIVAHRLAAAGKPAAPLLDPPGTG